MELGLTFAESALLVTYDPLAETAYWKFDRRTGQESIHVGAAIASLELDCLLIALRHEILHRSIYHGWNERFQDPAAANLALDVCINRLLYEAYPESMRKASLAIYPPNKKENLASLADCTAGEFPLDPAIRRIWESAWVPDAAGHLPSINPSSLYYEIRSLLKRSDRGTACPIGDHQSEQNDGLPKIPSPVVTKAAQKVGDAVARRLPARSGTGESLAEYSVIPTTINGSVLQDFIQRLRIQRVVSDVATKLIEPFQRRTRLDPYPMFPTRLGLIYRALGITEITGLYWNQETAISGGQFALGIYVDVSGSMERHYPVVATIVDQLHEYALRIKVFDDRVRDAELEELRRGRIRGGGGTSFDAVLRDLADTKEIVAGIMVTDGEGEASSDAIHAFRVSAKRLYVVVLGDPSKGIPPSLESSVTECVSLNLQEDRT
jgi:hypothetical protein